MVFCVEPLVLVEPEPLVPVEPPDGDPPDPLPPPGNTCMAVALLAEAVMVKSPATAPFR